ncbi:MAG: hypothetical protein WC061_08385 [Melioribacteraceae bacterium]
MLLGSRNKDNNPDSPGWNSVQERTFLENLLNQRISFFLIFFSLIIAGTVFIKSKIFFLAIMSIGVVISWVLALTIFVTVNRLGSLDNKLFARIVRWLIGYFLPFFCSMLITIALAAGAFGYLDSYLLQDLGKVKTVEEGIKKIEKAIANKDSSTLKNDPNFKDINTVIKEGARIEQADQTAQKAAVEVKKNSAPLKPNPNFKSIESIINEKKKR